MSEHKELLIEDSDWNVPENGALRDRYAIYLSCANDGNGKDSLTGEPLLTLINGLILRRLENDI